MSEETSWISPAHEQWKQQGGSNPGAPATSRSGPPRVIDWSQPKEKLAFEIADALRSDGFFYLINHQLNDKVYSTMALCHELFQRRKAAKLEEIQRIQVELAHRPMMKCARGYSDVRTEALNPVQGPDVKETFDYSIEWENSQPQSVHLGRNVWPREGWGHVVHPVPPPPGPPTQVCEALAPQGFRTACEDYLQSTFQLSRQLLELICLGIGMTAEEYESVIIPMFDEPLVVNRLIRYPAPPAVSRPVRPPVAPGGFVPIPQGAFESRLNNSILIAQKFSKFASFHPTYAPLFKALWRQYDPHETGKITAAQATYFAKRMVFNGWADWEPTPRDTAWWSQLEKEFGAVLLEHFAECSENEVFSITDKMREEHRERQTKEMGAGSHVDYGAITLIAEDCAGLEIQRRGDFATPWEPVPHLEGAFIVNTGYVLEKLTNGKIPATRHRVVASEAHDRHSLALFLDPHPDRTVAPLASFVGEGGKALYEACIAGHKGVRFGKPAYLEAAARRP